MAVGWVCSVVVLGGITAEIQMIATENVGLMVGARAVVVLMGEVAPVRLKVVVVRVKIMARVAGMVGMMAEIRAVMGVEVALNAADCRGGNCRDWDTVCGEWVVMVYWVVIVGRDV